MPCTSYKPAQIGTTYFEKKNKKRGEDKMLTKVPAFAVYSAQNTQQTSKARPPAGGGKKKAGYTCTKHVGMQTVQEEDEDYVVV
jgi:hypothetical protein